MRLDQCRAQAIALITCALLAFPVLPIGASAQDPGGFQRGGPPSISLDGQPPSQVQSGQEEGVTNGRAVPVNLDAVPTDTASLARFIPSEAMGVYVEFVGLNAAPDEWRGSSAYGILNETTLGAMLRELVSQAIEIAPGAPAGVMTGPEVAAMAEHVARHGLVVASPRDFERQSHYVVVVLRNAAHREVRGLFGKFIGTIAAPGTEPQVVSKAGNRQVVVMDTPAFGIEGSSDWAWWIEGDDLVLVINGAEASDLVVSTLDGEEPSVEGDALRQEQMAEVGTYRPLAFGTWIIDRPGADPSERVYLEEHGLRRIEFLWGFDGRESLTVMRLDAPSPRAGVMAVFDQPAIPLGELPPIPSDVTDVAVLSIDPVRLFDAVVAMAEQGDPGLAQPLKGFEQAVRDRARLDLRNDILAALGPKVAAYTLPRSAPRPPGGGNPLSGVLNALSGLDLPQFAVAIQLDTASSFNSKLDGLILAINQQLSSTIARFQPESPDPEGEAMADGRPSIGASRPQLGAEQRPAAAPEPFKFTMTLAEPRTYLLRLPEGLYGLTGYQPTITLGRQHLIFASTPVAARQCRELESRDSGRWSPGGELGSRLPAGLTMFVLNDLSQTLHPAIASLPATLNAILVSPPEAAPGGRPGLAFDGSVRGPSEVAPDAESGASPDGSTFDPNEGYIEGTGDEGGPSGGPGLPGDEGPRGPAPTSIRIPLSFVPRPDALRDFLYPALYTVSADDAVVRLEAREPLPGQWILFGFGTGPLLPLLFPLPSNAVIDRSND